jgi:hypothetical protein
MGEALAQVFSLGRYSDLNRYKSGLHDPQSGGSEAL